MDQTRVQKKRLKMLCEGSVLTAANGYPAGDVVDVRPDGFTHPVYRFGKAFAVSLED